MRTQRFALSILDGTIQRAWRVLPAEQAEGIKEFVVQTVIELASSFETLESERAFVLKLNQVRLGSHPALSSVLVVVTTSPHTTTNTERLMFFVITHRMHSHSLNQSITQSRAHHHNRTHTHLHTLHHSPQRPPLPPPGVDQDCSAGVARQVDDIHLGPRWREQKLRVALREQHAHPEAPQ